ENDQPANAPEVSDSTLLWTLLEELASTQSYLEVILRKQARIRAELEQRSSEDILGEMEIDQAKVFKFLWPRVLGGMARRQKIYEGPDSGEVREYPPIDG